MAKITVLAGSPPGECNISNAFTPATYDNLNLIRLQGHVKGHVNLWKWSISLAHKFYSVSVYKNVILSQICFLLFFKKLLFLGSVYNDRGKRRPWPTPSVCQNLCISTHGAKRRHRQWMPRQSRTFLAVVFGFGMLIIPRPENTRSYPSPQIIFRMGTIAKRYISCAWIQCRNYQFIIEINVSL